MIIEGHGNLLETQADALVNTVNTVGVMGKGIALQFKQAFPKNFLEYQAACKRGDLRIGRMFVTYTGMLQPRVLINFPTKNHWKGHSNLEDIRAGLKDLVKVIQEEQLRSVAIPPLGCGLGGLRWEEVRPEIEAAFSTIPEVDAILFPPGGAPAPIDRIVRTAKPELNAWRASLIKIVQAYMLLGFEATHQEAQKLLYFLKVSGEPIRTNFLKGDFGPFDRGMRFALLQMEGHYINGFGDGGRLDPVNLVAGAAEAAQTYLEDSPDTNARIEIVTRLIDGFQSPYGLELLATVHWVCTQEGAMNESEAIQLSQAWSPRKKLALREHDLRVAWQTLKSQGWLERT